MTGTDPRSTTPAITAGNEYGIAPQEAFNAFASRRDTVLPRRRTGRWIALVAIIVVPLVVLAATGTWPF